MELSEWQTIYSLRKTNRRFTQSKTQSYAKFSLRNSAIKLCDTLRLTYLTLRLAFLNFTVLKSIIIGIEL